MPASATFEAFIELQLAISAEEVLSVADAFARMTRPETLHGAPPALHSLEPRRSAWWEGGEQASAKKTCSPCVWWVRLAAPKLS